MAIDTRAIASRGWWDDTDDWDLDGSGRWAFVATDGYLGTLPSPGIWTGRDASSVSWTDVDAQAVTWTERDASTVSWTER